MATYSWLGTTSTWSTATNWKTGGLPAISAPGAGDDCVFDGSDGGSSSAVCTLTGSTTVLTVDFSSYTGTFTHNLSVTLTIAGLKFKFVSGMTYTRGNNTSSALSFTNTSGSNVLITTAGKITSNVTFGTGPVTGGVYQLQDDLNATGSTSTTVTLLGGTLDFNNKQVLTGLFTASGASVRAITLGTGTIILFNGSAGTVLDCSGTNITGSMASGTITYSGAPSTNTTLNFGTSTLMGSYGTVNLSTSSWAYAFTATTALTIATLNLTSLPLSIRFPAGITTTFSNALVLLGAPATPIGLVSATVGNTATISVAASSSIGYAWIKDLTFTGNAITASSSFDGKNNSGITINPPGSGQANLVGGFQA